MSLMVSQVIGLYDLLADDVIDIHHLQASNARLKQQKEIVNALISDNLARFSDGIELFHILSFYYNYIEMYRTRLEEIKSAKIAKEY
jgi:hypothetical protein